MKRLFLIFLGEKGILICFEGLIVKLSGWSNWSHNKEFEQLILFKIKIAAYPFIKGFEFKKKTILLFSMDALNW